MQNVYVDEETSLEIRPMNLDDKTDIKFFIQANKNIIFQLWQFCPQAKLDWFYSKPYLAYMHIGLGMRVEHLYEKEKGYVIIKDGKVVGTGWVSEVTAPAYYYPVVSGCELTLPLTKQTADMHLAIARMMKEKGHNKIYTQLFKGDPVNNYIPFKKVGEWPLPPRQPLWDFGEVII